MPQPPSRKSIERAGDILLSLGACAVIIRSGPLGAYVKESRTNIGIWIPAFFSSIDSPRVIDVTGAGNAFLGGLIAGLSLTNGDVFSGQCRNHAHHRVCNVNISLQLRSTPQCLHPTQLSRKACLRLPEPIRQSYGIMIDQVIDYGCSSQGFWVLRILRSPFPTDVRPITPSK